MCMKSVVRKILLLVLLTIAIVSPVFADSDGFSFKRLTFNGSGEFFKLDVLTDSVISGTGLAFLGTELALNKFAHLKNSVWSGEALNKDDVSAFDSFFMQPFSNGLNITGDIFQFAALLSPAVLMVTPMEEWLTIGVMYAETVLATYSIKEFSKALVTRVRPYMYYDEKPQDLVAKGDWNESFPSGHSALAFSGATFLSYVFSKYYSDSPWKYAVTAASYSVAAATAFFRVAGGKHFLSDVLTGAAIGTAIGYVVPWLHTLKAGNNVNSGAAGASRNVEPLVCLDRVALRISF